MPSEHGEEPIEDLERDIDQLLQILRDMDQARGEDAQDLKEHMNRIEDELRDLADFIRRQPPPPASVPEARPRVEMPTPIIIRPEPVQMPVPQPAPPPLPVLAAPPLLRVKDVSVGGSSPIPETPLSGESRVMSPPSRQYLEPIMLSPPRSAPSPSVQSSVMTEMSYLSSPHSDDASLMGLELYPPDDESPSITMSPSAESRVLSAVGSASHQSPPLLSPLPSSPELSPSGSDGTLSDGTFSEREGPSVPPMPSSSPSSPPESSLPTTPPDSEDPSDDSVSSVGTVRPASQNLDLLRNLIEALRDRTLALLDGQAGTNRMLDDLISRRPPLPDNTAMNERLLRIEAQLDRILRDLGAIPRGMAPPPVEGEPSDISSETSSAIRRYLDRLRDPRRFDMPQLEVPRPVRLHPPSLDTEWAEFLNAPAQAADRSIQGPPPLIPLVRRTVGIPRVESPSPPSILSPPRSQSVPLYDRVRIDDVPPLRGHRSRPWIWPRLGEGVRPRQPPRRPPVVPIEEQSEPEIWYDDTDTGMPVPGAPRPTRGHPQRPFDVDFLERVRRGRAGRRPDAPDGFYNASRPVRHTGDDISYFLLLICTTFRDLNLWSLREL